MSDAADLELIRRLELAVSKLPPKQREIFLAHRLDNASYEELARRTGLSVGRVERHMARAIYKLAKQLDGGKLNWFERHF